MLKDDSEVDDREVKLLTRSLPLIVQSGRSKGTVKKYHPAWVKWLDWCKTKPEVCPRPAEPFYVAIYFNHLLFMSGRKGCIAAAMYGIRWGHHIVGLPSPTDNPLVQLAFEGSTRLCGGITEKMEALPVQTLKDLISNYCNEPFNLLNLRFVVTCLLSFAGFFRIDEVINSKVKQVSFFEDHLQIFLEKSKTDQQRHGNKVLIAATGTEYCPVTYVRNFFELAKLDRVDTPEAYVIPRMYKTKRGHVASKIKGISYTTIRDIFKERTRALVPENTRYGLHSLRSGGASSAAQNGVTDRLISKQGRWASEKGRNGYIQDSVRSRLKVSLCLGL